MKNAAKKITAVDTIGMTLHEALRACGYEDREDWPGDETLRALGIRCASGTRPIYRLEDGSFVGALLAREGWELLRADGHIVYADP